MIKPHKREEIFIIILGLFIIILMSLSAVAIVISIIDSITLKYIGEESVPCLDKYNRPFENEMCTKTLKCSWLGLTGDYRCANVLGDSK
jgi:hypothetical protein